MGKIRMKIGGVEVECDSPEDARAILLLGNLNGSGTKSAAVSSLPSYRSKGQKTLQIQSVDRMEAFLGKLATTSGPVKSTVLCRAAGMKAGRGIGGLIGGIDRRLRDAGMDRDQVCGQQLIGIEHYWVAGPKINEALALIQAEKKKREEAAS